MIRIRGRLYYSARLAVFYVTGEWPKDEVDHIDRDPSNDRWVNIREATSSQNKYNKTRTGIVGIYLSGSVAGTWWAMAGKKYLGSFSSIEEAIEARKVALLELGHGDFAELN